MDFKLRNLLMLLVPTTILSVSFFWWKHKMLKFKSLKNDIESEEVSKSELSKSSEKQEIMEEVCVVEEQPVDFVEIDTFDDSLTLQDFTHSSKRKREHSSCDGDSAFVEDFSSDNLSISGSDSNSNKTPIICETPANEEMILPIECENTENPPNDNIRDWFGPALETECQDKFADIINWGSQPASDFEGDFGEKSEHEVIAGVPIEKLSIVLEKEYTARKEKFSKRKVEKNNKTPKKSQKSLKKSPRSPKKKSNTDSPKQSKSPKHKRTPRCRDNRDLDKPWREHTDANCSTTSEVEIESYPIYPNDYAVLEYLIPDDLCGKIIGKHGKAVKEINEKTGAYVCVESEKVEDKCILSLSGLFHQVQDAEKILLSKYKSSMQKYVAEMPKNFIVEGITLRSDEYINVIVTAVINAGNLCLQKFDSEIDSKLVQLQNDMHEAYSTPPQRVFYHDSRKPKVAEICISFIDNIWCRVQVQEYIDDAQIAVLFIDYGGSVVVPWQMLYKARKEFLQLPSQAIQCFLADSYPLPGKESYSYSANLTFNQLVEGKVLKAYVHSIFEDVPCVELFYINEETNVETSINTNLIDWGLVSPYIAETYVEDVAQNDVHELDTEPLVTETQ